MIRRKTASVLIALGLMAFLLPQSGNCSNGQSEVLVPGDMVFMLELLSPISTKTNKKGDEFTCKVLSPSDFANAYVSGKITKVKGSGKATGKSEIALAFDHITMSDERRGVFSAQVTEVYDVVGSGEKGKADEEGTVTGKSTRKRDAVRIGVSTAIGAIVGGLLGGARGAVIGGAIGAGLGVTNTLSTKGPDLEFDKGTRFSVRTDARAH